MSEQVEHTYEKVRILIFGLAGVVFVLVMIFVSKWFCMRQFTQMQDIPPEWVDEYHNECDRGLHPSWFYLHLS